MKKIKYADLYTLRKDGRYMGYYKDDKGIRHAVYDRDPERLYNRLSEIEQNKNRSSTFLDIAENWKTLHEAEIRTGTKVCYAPAYARAIEAFGDALAVDLLPFDIHNLLTSMKNQGYSAQTIKVQKSVIKQIYDLAIRDQKFGKEIRSNPATLCPLPQKLPKPMKREAPEDDITNLIRKNYDKPFGLYPLVLVSTGCRRGECLALQWKDIDIENKLITINKALNYEGVAEISETKTTSGERIVPLLPDLEIVISDHYADHDPDEYIFHGKDPYKFISESTFKRYWLKYCKTVGLVDENGKTFVTSHNFRHGYATLLYEAGVDMYTAQKLLGHANVDTTMKVYTHLRKRKEQESLAALSRKVLEVM